MEWVLLAFIFLLIWGNISRKSRPIIVKSQAKAPLCAVTPTGGDSFASGNTMVAGVNEPCGPTTARPAPIATIFPVDLPPPIAIQTQRPAPVTVSTPVISRILPPPPPRIIPVVTRQPVPSNPIRYTPPTRSISPIAPAGIAKPSCYGFSCAPFGTASLGGTGCGGGSGTCGFAGGRYLSVY